jgi:hypothetical protein
MGPLPNLVRIATSATATLCALVLVSGCAPSARQRPIQTSPVATSGDTLEGARRALDGKWTLVSLNVTAPDGRKAAIEAAGTLVSDAFGNLSVEYRMSPAGQKTLEGVGINTPNPVVTTSGRVVIDVDKKQITYVSEKADAKPFDAELAARRNNPFALERPRYYAVDADGLLTLTTRYDDGTAAAVSRWKKSS